MGKSRRVRTQEPEKSSPLQSSVPSYNRLWTQSWPALLLVVSFALLTRLNVLANGFGWDDEVIIQNLTTPTTGWDLLLPNPAAPYYRPLISLSYLLDFKIWGRNPFGFHLSVLIAHLINTALVFFLSQRLMTAHGNDGLRFPTLTLFPLIVASLFAVHPVHSEAVAWIAGRNDVFCATFMLSSLILYIGHVRNRRRWTYGGSMAAFLFALLSKETSIGLVLLFPLYDCLASEPRSGSRTPFKTFFAKMGVRVGIKSFVPLVLLGVYFTGLFFWHRIEKLDSHYDAASLPTFLSQVSGSKLLDMVGAAGLYIKLMVFPYPHQPFIDHLPTSPEHAALAFMVWTLIIGGLLWSMIRRQVRVGIGLAWMSALLAPAIFVAAIGGPTTAAAERYLYAPSIGFLIAAACLADWGLKPFHEPGRLRRGVWVTAGMVWIGIVVIGGWESWNRNTVWRSPVTFWQAAVAGLPESGFAHRELGLRNAQIKQYDEAERHYLQAIEIYEKGGRPDALRLGDCLNDLAAFYYMQKKLAEAEPLYQRSLAIREKMLGAEHPDVAQSLNNLVALYYAQGRYAEAEPLSRRSVKIRETALGSDHPDVATSLNNLAGIYFIEGKYTEAEPLFKRVVAIREKVLRPDHPDLASSLQNYAVLLRKMKREGEAQEMESRAKAIRNMRVPENEKQ